MPALLTAAIFPHLKPPARIPVLQCPRTAWDMSETLNSFPVTSKGSLKTH